MDGCAQACFLFVFPLAFVHSMLELFEKANMQVS